MFSSCFFIVFWPVQLGSLLVEAAPVRLVKYTKVQVQRVVDELTAPRYTDLLLLGGGGGVSSRTRSTDPLVISDEEGDVIGAANLGSSSAAAPGKRRHESGRPQVPLKKCRTQYRGLEKCQDELSLNMGFRNAGEVARLKETLLINGGFTLKAVSR
jgi:hypothetical protein